MGFLIGLGSFTLSFFFYCLFVVINIEGRRGNFEDREKQFVVEETVGPS